MMNFFKQCFKYLFSYLKFEFNDSDDNLVQLLQLGPF